MSERLTLAASNSPVEAAWAAFDTAAIRLHRLYGRDDFTLDTPEQRERRQRAAQEVVRLWDEWQKLFLGDQPDPRPAA